MAFNKSSDDKTIQARAAAAPARQRKRRVSAVRLHQACDRLAEIKAMRDEGLTESDLI